MTTKLILLGTSSPRVEPNKVQTSFLLIVDGCLYMIDCGSGAHERLVQALAKHGDGLETIHMNHLFLTHLHPDHTVDIPSILIAPWQLGRETAVNIWGPAGTQEMINHILEAYKIGNDELRLHGPRVREPIGAPVNPITEGVFFEDERLKLEAFKVDHGNLEAYAFRATTADKVIFFSGDTCPVDVLAEGAKGCDILVMEAYCAAGMPNVPERWQWYFPTVHTSGIEVGQIAAKAQPGLVILNHQMCFGGTTDADLVQEVRDGGYTGELVSGQDLQVFE